MNFFFLSLLPLLDWVECVRLVGIRPSLVARVHGTYVLELNFCYAVAVCSGLFLY